MNGTMNCAVFADVERMEYMKRPIPGCPKGGLLVKVLACGICGGDVRNFHNGLKGGITNQIMGHEIAGEIVEADAAVTRFIVGDRVALAPDVSCGTCWYCRRGLVNLCQNHRMLGTHLPGGYAQYIALDQDVLSHGFIEKIPDNMPYDHAAFAETASAVVACQARVNVSLGDVALIIGDGPVGCLHIEVARARGAGKVLLAGMDRLALAERFSPDLLLDNRDPEQVAAGVMEATGGIGADVVICAVPSVEPQQQALELCRKRGWVIIYGGVPKSAEMTTLNSNLIHYNELNLTGAFSYPPTALADALRAIAAGQIDPKKYISCRVPLHEVTHGMDLMQRGEALKVIVEPWPN